MSTPQKSSLGDKAPTREQLETWLLNGDWMIDTTQLNIDTFKLPYRIVISDGTQVWKGRTVKQGWGILMDTLSRGELKLNQFVTEDPTCKSMKSDALKCANTPEPYEVLITGETGTGKEIIGSAMIGHRKGEIKAINCAAMPEYLIESELFGYVKGAFTGAYTDKDGLCQEAADGVLFLDEIAELPLSVQSKLLRAIQERKVRKVGGLKDEPISCRFVCATLHNIKKMVEDGQFRRDLYARISTLELHISPLRERMGDVIPITRSIKGHEKFLAEHEKSIELLDLSLNVRSLQQYVIRYNILGRLKSE